MIFVSKTIETLEKTAAKPTLGSFYIVGNAIYYSTIDGGIAHDKLWKEIVYKSGLFDNLVYENKKDLAESPYAVDRGRLTWHGKLKPDGQADLSDSDGYFILYGTPGAEKHSKLLKTIFGVRSLRKGLEVKEDWKTDDHYKVLPQDKKVLEDMVKLLGGEDKFKPKTTLVAQCVPTLKDKIRKVLSRKSL
jgi:hypothetical protein